MENISQLIEHVENKNFTAFRESIQHLVEEKVVQKFVEAKNDITSKAKVEDNTDEDEESLDEAVKIDVDFDDTDVDIASLEKKHGIKIKVHRHGAYLTGDKQKLKKYLMSKDYGLTKDDIEDMYPEIL